MSIVRIGARGSRLSRAQAGQMQARIAAAEAQALAQAARNQHKRRVLDNGKTQLLASNKGRGAVV